METMRVCGKDYEILRLLGRGKGGYSYLCRDTAGEYVLKQLHHEPCEYYQFGDKFCRVRGKALLRRLRVQRIYAAVGF